MQIFSIVYSSNMAAANTLYIVQYPNWPLFHGSLIQNWGRIGLIVLCMNNGGGSGAKAKKDIRQGDGGVGGYKNKQQTPFELPTCPSRRHPTRHPCLFLVRARFKRVAVGFTAKEAHMMVLSAFIALNILIGASPVLFVTFQRLISSRGTFWPV